MNARVTTIAVAAAALAVGYAFGSSQRTGSAMGLSAQALAPQGSRAGVDDQRAWQPAIPGNEHAEHMLAGAGGALQAAPVNLKLPADEDGAKQRLNASPRHGELVKYDAGIYGKTTAWVSYPEVRDKAPVVLVVQEIFGLSDWLRAVADQLAAEGFIAVAPDLLSGHGPNGGGTDSFANRDDVTKASTALSSPEVTGRLNGARDYAMMLPSASGKLAIVGFCFGGSQSFRFAMEQPALKAAVVYYGTAPAAPTIPGSNAPFTPARQLANLSVPVLGLYGGSDERIGATVPATQTKLKELGKTYEVHTFEGAGHGFLRAQTGQSGANMKASEQAWPLTVAWLKKYTS